MAVATGAYAGWRAHVRSLLLAAGYSRSEADPLAELLLAPLGAEDYRHLRLESGVSRQRVLGSLAVLARAVLDRSAPGNPM